MSLFGARPQVHVEYSRGYIWDTNTLDWIPDPGTSGGGGGGGAVTIADGADVAEGGTTDAAIDSDSSGSISGKLRGLVKILASVWDNVNGRLNVSIGGSLPSGLATLGKINQGAAANTSSSAWWVRYGAETAYQLSTLTTGSVTTAGDVITFPNGFGMGAGSQLVVFTVAGTYTGASFSFKLVQNGFTTGEAIRGWQAGTGQAQLATSVLSNVTRTWFFYVPNGDNSGGGGVQLRITLDTITSGSVDYWISQSAAPSLPFATVNDGGDSLTVDGSVTAAVTPMQLTTASGSVSSSGNNTLVTPTSGKKVRIYYLSYNPASPVELAFRFGAAGNLFLRNNIVQGGSIVSKDYGDFRYVEGAVDEALILNLSSAVTTIWNANYIEV